MATSEDIRVATRENFFMATDSTPASTFSGTFRSRMADGPRGLFQSFSPAMSAKAKKAISESIRAWHLKLWSGADLSSIAREINPLVRGWVSYYGAFYSSELDFLVRRINQHLVRWALHKYKRLRRSPRRAWQWLNAIISREPLLFAHWGMSPNTRRRAVGAG